MKDNHDAPPYMHPTYHELRHAPVYFIKLGEGGKWERECFDNHKLKFGYEAAPRAFAENAKWEDLRRYWIEKEGKNPSVAQSIVRQTSVFHTASDSAVFVTFAEGSMLWSRAAATVHWNDDGTTERQAIGGWQSRSISGKPLTTSSLSGELLCVQMYRQTICNVRARDYAIRKITDTPLPEVENAIAAATAMRVALLQLIRKLGPKDFELLLELIFSTSGWRRLTPIGKSQRDTDFDLYLPTTQERAFVQVKSKATQADLQNSIAVLANSDGYHRLFFVHHTGEVAPPPTHASRVTLLGPERVAEMAMDAGLASWLMDKVL